MRSKRDPIFWAAAAIFAVAVLLGAVLDDSWLLLLVVSYLLRPTVHALGFLPRLTDERETRVQDRASSVAFATVLAGLFVVIVVLMRRGDHTWEMLVAVLMVSLAARALASVLMTVDPHVAGARILVATGLLLALLGGAELPADPSGIVAHVLPGLALAAVGVYARRNTRLAGAAALVLAIVGVGMLVVPLAAEPSVHWGKAVGAALLLAPLLVAGICLLRPARADDDDVRPPRGPTPSGAAALALLALLALPSGARAQPTHDPRFECTPWGTRAQSGTGCRLRAADTVFGRAMPAGTLFRFDSTGTYRFFALFAPDSVGGLHLAGGPDGISHDVYPNGAPRALWLHDTQVVQGVRCRGYSALGEIFRRTARVQFAPDGRFVSCRRVD